MLKNETFQVLHLLSHEFCCSNGHQHSCLVYTKLQHKGFQILHVFISVYIIIILNNKQFRMESHTIYFEKVILYTFFSIWFHFFILLIINRKKNPYYTLEQMCADFLNGIWCLFLFPLCNLKWIWHNLLAVLLFFLLIRIISTLLHPCW